MSAALEAPDRAEARAVAECVEYYLGELPVSVARYPSSSSRQVYRIRMRDRDVVLKSLGGKRLASVSCVFVTNELCEAGVPTPRVLGAEAGDRSGFGLLMGRPFVLTEAVPGERLDTWLQSGPGDDAAGAAFTDLGRVLRRFHSAAPLAGLGKVNDHGVGDCSTWWEYLEGHRISHPDGRLTRVLEVAGLVEQGLLDPGHAEWIDSFFTGENPLFDLDRPSLLHNDVTLRNVLVDPEEKRVSGLIDLHNVVAGSPALELARFEYFYEERGYLPALLEGYGREYGESRAVYLAYVLLEKVQWLISRQQRFPGRLPRDVERLRAAIEALS